MVHGGGASAADPSGHTITSSMAGNAFSHSLGTVGVTRRWMPRMMDPERDECNCPQDRGNS